MTIDPYYQQQKDSSWSVEFTDIHVVHKSPGRVTHNQNFKVTEFFIINSSEVVQDIATLTMAD